MKSVVDPSFRGEAERFNLRFSCEDCAHYDERSEACSNGYPNAAHRAPVLETARELEFCKQFELA